MNILHHPFQGTTYGALTTKMVIKGRTYNIDIWDVDSIDKIHNPNYVILLESEGMPITHEVDIPYKFCIQEYENYAKETVLPYVLHSLGHI